MSKRKQPAEERTPKNPPSEDGDRRSSYMQCLRAERGTVTGARMKSSNYGKKEGVETIFSHACIHINCLNGC